MVFSFKICLLYKEIHVYRHHVDQTVSVRKPMLKLCVPVNQSIWEHHPHAGPNVLLVQNVINSKLVLIKDVKTLAKASADKMLNAKL